MSGPYYAVIHPASPRRDFWLKLFGRDWLAIESPDPVEGEDVDGPGMFYLARVQDLEPAVVDRLVAHFARLWRCPGREVIEDLFGDNGLPIRAGDDVLACADPAEGRAALAGKGGAP